ncbi:hypothetical protein P9112_008881 [Eukaryota sp. TZLM1-RC]
MLLDSSDAFNSIHRCSIHGALLNYLPELMPYFQSTYCTNSDFHFADSILNSSSSVKQEDPLGPLLFCLAIHPILLQIQEMFPSLKMIAFMEDVLLIGDLKIVRKATVCFKELFNNIGIRVDLLKCVFLSNSPVSTIVDGIEVQAMLYSTNVIRHFEFSERFADWGDLLMTTQSSTVFSLNEEISKIYVEKWSRCFPQLFNANNPEKTLLNLKYTLGTLQKRLT